MLPYFQLRPWRQLAAIMMIAATLDVLQLNFSCNVELEWVLDSAIIRIRT